MNGHRARALRKQYGPQGRPYNPLPRSIRDKRGATVRTNIRQCVGCGATDGLTHYGDYGSYCKKHEADFLRPYRAQGKTLRRRIRDCGLSMHRVARAAGMATVRLSQICYGSILPLPEREAGRPQCGSAFGVLRTNLALARKMDKPPSMHAGEHDAITSAIKKLNRGLAAHAG